MEKRKKGKLQSKTGTPLRENGTGFLPIRKVLAAEWQRRHLEYYPEEPCSCLPVRTARVLWRYAYEWTEGRKEGEFLDYLDWVIRRWRTIRISTLKWMKNCPALPCAEKLVIIKLRPDFENAYRYDQELIEREASMTPAERKERFLVEEKGMDPEAAAHAVREIRGVEEEKKRLAKAQRVMKVREERVSRLLLRHAAPAKPKERKPFTNTYGWKEEEAE